MKAAQEFPEALPDWNNINVIHRNTIAPRSNFYLYDTEADALTRDITKAKAQCLSGRWMFHLSKSPFAGPLEFYQQQADLSEFSDIAVPGMWQLQGYGRGPWYTNIMYPWSVDPPHVSHQENECGRYIRTFEVRDSFANHQLRLRFEGVDAAFKVWLNGKEVGYSQGSRNPSEFDVTAFIEFSAENVLAVEVYQRCDGSYIEDQDQWWLSGIFRDVFLHAFPKVHLCDFQVWTDLDEAHTNGTLTVRVETSGPSRVELKLLDMVGNQMATEVKKISASGSFEVAVDAPAKWTAETPNLYTLILNILEGDGCSAVHRVGFRTVGLIDGVFCVNGNPVKLRGVNRHEHDPEHGRAVPYDFMKNDLLTMKRHNINAIRTSHQINDPRLYDLADELGLWIMDEADLECHGFEEADDSPEKYTSDNPVWKNQYLDRARQMVARDKNHTCIIMWSLGNEAFYGQNHAAMYHCIKDMDSSRLIHYEGDQDAQTADIFGRMYPSVDTVVEDFAEAKDWEKPLVLCEFLHSMGNSLGNAREYIEAFYQYPRLMGGFVWEWANHGLRARNEEGKEYIAYGGDFGDEPNDYNFIMDGLLFSNHTPSPNIIEYGKSIEPVQTISKHGNKVTVVNRYDFIGLSHLVVNWEVVTDGQKLCAGTGSMSRDVRPHTKGEITIDGFHDGLLSNAKGEAHLKLTFRLKEATNWAPAGHQVAFGQLSLSKPLSLSGLRRVEPPMPKPFAQKIRSNRLSVTSATKGSEWIFNLVSGALVSWRRAAKPDRELITEPLTMGFYRALTDNDRGGHGRGWSEGRLHQALMQTRHVEWRQSDDGIEVEVQARIAPPVLAWAVEVVLTYRFRGDSMTIHAHGRPQGARLPETFARIGITLGIASVHRVQWWGRGPGESYRDRKHSQAFGNWEASVDDLWVDYEFPQDNGNRTDVRRVEFLDDEGGRILWVSFGDLEEASFSAMHYTTADIDECTHPYQLHERKRADTIVRLDWMHHGLGTGSCGPPTLPEYQLRTDKEFDVELLLE